MPFHLWKVLIDGELVGYVRAPDRHWAWAQAGNRFQHPRNLTVEEA